MIVAIGNDLIELERIRRVWRRDGDHFLGRIFHEVELEYCLRMSDPLPSLAARFAAKEAFQKVWPRPHGWKEVWVRREPTPNGPFSHHRPVLCFSEDIALELEERRWTAHLSLTHTREHAAAVVVLEGF